MTADRLTAASQARIAAKCRVRTQDRLRLHGSTVTPEDRTAALVAWELAQDEFEVALDEFAGRAVA